MAQMDYFRRPILAGKSLKRLSVGTIRGTLKRLNPDGISNVPYFPGVIGGDTVNVNVFDMGIPGPVTVPVTLSSSSFATILSDFNTALVGKARAFDADGTVGLKSLTPGSDGYIEVTGG